MVGNNYQEILNVFPRPLDVLPHAFTGKELRHAETDA
jgi:hypothetical protein